VAQALGEQLHRIGGAPYLHTCMESVPTAGSAGWWAQILLDKAYARRVATRFGQIGRSEELDAPLPARVRAEYAALLEAESKGWTDPAPLGKATTDLPEFPR
jgi:replicative DNA helicase